MGTFLDRDGHFGAGDFEKPLCTLGFAKIQSFRKDLK